MQKKTDARLEMLALFLCDLWVVKGHWVKTVYAKTERGKCSFAMQCPQREKCGSEIKMFLSSFSTLGKKSKLKKITMDSRKVDPFGSSV